ncbi:alpha/beta hydrolase fold protein [Fibrisoma limi BUZ 3]|uniref:Alpha/beta hydrolase fold protein n=1 Tax=Fibrisoma limi BUZ 3 TaxID=1185876 RepID=I2GM86_9BACT|nr:alpha/beta hydrolase [Fibrisoma limi]CCH55013.1 alpha/beta hydrolase fold protein [Fibrisoma limi BUZ 3]
MRLLLLLVVGVIGSGYVGAQTPGEVTYPYPVQYLSLTIESQPVQMAYMDVKPARPNGQTALLLHGKNFNGFYWANVVRWLSDRGYRVVVPDQVGWGKSSHPNIHYSFHLLADNTRQLLDKLKIDRVVVLAHSMGGMLGTRFTLMFPDRVSRLVLENPIGLEDYKTFVPYQSIDAQYKKEVKATYESYKQYQQTYYPVWKPEYEALVKAQASDLDKPNFEEIAWANALTYQMIYEQPVVYEFDRIRVPTLLIIGQEDRTVVGKALLPKDQQAKYGQYPELGKQTARRIQQSKLVELPGVGHIPHIQTPELYVKALSEFLP